MATYSFRPSARIINTIGAEIIKDMHAALVELVKNAYDADANYVEIIFKKSIKNGLVIKVKDDGHGMSFDDLTNKWLVISTDDKLSRKTSPKGRKMQGRKGIGRFAAAILGENLKLETIDNHKKTVLKIHWRDFSDKKYLDEIEYDIKSYDSDIKHGSLFTIYASNEKKELWTTREIDSFIKELRKLLTPIELDKKQDDFKISINFKNSQFEEYVFEKYGTVTLSIEPLPLIEYYDYRIYGSVYSDGSSDLIYHNKEQNIKERIKDFKYDLIDDEAFTGKIYLDFRIFDRDPQAIENLVTYLSVDSNKTYKKNEAKKMLDDISGVSIFRNGFRIRPYGDAKSDWLGLDEQRVQNPSLKIGANQIFGVIQIENEEISHLEEKSARDGLKEDKYYAGLVKVINSILTTVELKRYNYRQKTGKSRKHTLVSSKLNTLTDYLNVINKVTDALIGVNVSTVEKVKEIIKVDFEEKSKIAMDLERQLAIYQGQATLGKIMDVVMHEVRKPIGWLKNQSSNVERMFKRFLQNGRREEDLEYMIDIISKTPEELNLISDLFKRLDCLATRNRVAKKNYNVKDTIVQAKEIFLTEFKKSNISVSVQGANDIKVNGWKSDIIIALSNVLENAIYWLNVSNRLDKKIEIELCEDERRIYISIWNNGPKIINDLLQNNIIFDPGVSGKITTFGSGTGLGLAIAGEAIARNNGEIKVLSVDEGAKFLIEISKVIEVRNNGN